MPDNWKVDIANLNRQVATLLGVQQLEPAKRNTIPRIVAEHFDGEVTPTKLLQAVQQSVTEFRGERGEYPNGADVDLTELGLRYTVFEALNTFVRSDEVSTELDKLRLAHEHLVGLQAGLAEREPAAVRYAMPTEAAITKARRVIGGDGGSRGDRPPGRVRRVAGAIPVRRSLAGGLAPGGGQSALRRIPAGALGGDALVGPSETVTDGSPGQRSRTTGPRETVTPAPPAATDANGTGSIPDGVPSVAGPVTTDQVAIGDGTPPPDFHSLEAIQERLENSGRAGSMPNWRDLITVTEETGEDGERVIVYTARTHRPGESGEYSKTIFKEFFLGHTPHMAKAANAAVDAGDEEAFDRIVALWGAQMVSVGQMQIRVRGYEKLKPGQVYQFAPTHASQVEFPLILMIVNGFSTGYVARRIFERIPFIGPVMKKSPRFFFIDRGKKGKARELMDQVGAQLASEENRASVITFTQGTRALERRNKSGDRIDPDLFAKGPLRKGAAHAGLKTVIDGNPIPTVPITIRGVGRIKPKGWKTPVLTNQVVEVIIGDPIDPARFQVTETPEGEKGPHFVDTQRENEVVSKYEAAKRLTDEIEAVYRRDYEAPLMPPVLVRDPKKKANPWKPTLSDLRTPDLERLEGLRQIAVAPGQPVRKDEDAVLVKRAEYASLARVVLNRWLDPFREAFMYLDLGYDEVDDVAGKQENLFELFCLERGLNPEAVRNVREWIPDEELQGVYARAGINLNDPLVAGPDEAAEGEFADARDTTQVMRRQRAGLWALENVRKRFLDRFVRGDKTEKRVPNVVYHDQPQGETTFSNLQNAHRLSHDGDYERVGKLLESQVGFQSEGFQEEGWQPFLDRLASVQQPWNKAVADYIDRHEQSDHPPYEAVSEAALNLHRTILKSGAFPGVDEDLRIYAFYVYQVREEYERLRNTEGADVEMVEYNRRRYFGLLGRGIKYRILNELNRRLGGDPTNREPADILRAVAKRKDLVPLKDRAFRVEYVATLIRWNQTLRERLAEVDQKMAVLGKKLGPVRRKIHETSLNRLSFSYTALQYHRLHRERTHLITLIDECGDMELEQVLDRLAGEFQLSLTPQSDDASNPHEMPEAVAEAWGDYKRARGRWASDYNNHFREWVPAEMELYQRSFQTEYEMNQIEGEMQVARYEDLMAQLRSDKGPLSIDEEMRYAQALSDYQLKFADYLAVAENMTHGVETKKREPTRKKKEVELFFAMLRLHWAVTDLYKANGHQHAGHIRPISAMFPNQVKVLNTLGSSELEGLRPILESLTFEMIVNLYFEIFLGGNDPRHLDRIIGSVGMQATDQSTSRVNIYGARVLAGELGQSSGADSFLNGAGVLAEDQARRFGVFPQRMAFSANHQGFSDYTFFVALLASLGLGRPWVTYDAKNFDTMPLYGAVLSAGDGMGFARDDGGTDALQRTMRDGISRGVSPITFDHGTRRTTTTVSPLSVPGMGAFVPRHYVLGGSKAEAGAAARDAGIAFVPVHQHLDLNLDPDFGLTGDLGEKNFRKPWPIHAGTRLGGEGTMAFGDPIPAWVLPDSEADLRDLGVLPDGIENLDDKAVDRWSRLAIAAHTEFGRLRASFKPLQHLAGNGAPPSGSPPSGGGGGIDARDLARQGAVQLGQVSPVSAKSRAVTRRSSHRVTLRPFDKLTAQGRQVTNKRPQAGGSLAQVYMRLFRTGNSDLREELRAVEAELTSEQRGELARASRNGVALVDVTRRILSDLRGREADAATGQPSGSAAVRAGRTTGVVRPPVPVPVVVP